MPDKRIMSFLEDLEGKTPAQITPSDQLKELRARRELESLQRIESGQGTARDSLIAGEKPLPGKKDDDEKKGRKETNTDKLTEYLSLRNKSYSSAHALIPYVQKETGKKGEETITPVKMTMPERYKESDTKTAKTYQDSIDLTHDAMKMNVHVNRLRQAMDDAHANIQAVKEEAKKSRQRINMSELKQMIQQEYGIPWEMLAKYNYVR